MMRISDGLKLAIASAAITVLAIVLSLSGVTKTIGSLLLLTLAPVTSLVAIIYSVRDLIGKRTECWQLVASFGLSLIPFMIIYRIRF